MWCELIHSTSLLACHEQPAPFPPAYDDSMGQGNDEGDLMPPLPPQITKVHFETVGYSGGVPPAKVRCP